MRLRCIRSRPSPADVAELGDRFNRRQDFHLTDGREYVAMGLQFHVDAPGRGTGTWVHLVSDFGHLTWAPLQLFEITDARISRYWVARKLDAGLTLWPELLYREFFHDDLAERVPEVVEEFETLRSRLEAEAAPGAH